MKLTVNSIVKITVGFSLMFFTLLVLSSCEYDTDKIYDRDVEKNPTAPDIEITELHIGGDSVSFMAVQILTSALRVVTKK